MSMANYRFTFLSLLCCIGNTLQYELGVTYKYSYDTHVLLNEDPISSSQGGFVDKDVGYKVTGDVHFTNVWMNPSQTQEKLYKIELINPKSHVPTREERQEFKQHKSNLDDITSSLLYVHYDEGRIVKVFSLAGEDSSVTNLKKGLASLLQFRSESGEYNEVNACGQCKVKNEVEGDVIVKIINSCKHPKKGQFRHPHKVQSATLNSSSELRYKLTENKDVISSVEGNSKVKMFSNIWKRPALLVTSNLQLSLQGKDSKSDVVSGNILEEVIKLLPEGLKEDQVVTQPIDQTCKQDCKTLAEDVKNYKENLKSGKLATVESASAYLKLLEKYRTASKKEIVQVMKSSKNKSILPQIIDLVAAAQTRTSLEAAFEVIDFTSHNIDLPERFLLSLSVISHPSHATLVELLKVAGKTLKSEKIRSTLLLTIGAIAKTYCKVNEQNCKSQIIEDARTFLITELDKCQTTPCKEIYLKALRNAALPETIPTLLRYVQEGGKATVAALFALKNVDVKYITDEVKTILLKVYQQLWHREDSTARTLAAEILLLSRPNKELLKTIIEVLSSQDSPEVSTFVASKLVELIEKNEELRSRINEIQTEFQVANYHTLAQKGFSASFNKMMAEATGVNATYGVSMETMSGGILKRSSFDVNIHSSENELHLLSVGLFAGGLSSFAGEEDTGAEQEETTAGMELTLIGVNLRPYVFFAGTGEMMGHVWSGTASEPTLVFQANLLLLDHYQLVPLPNGLIINVNLRGVLSGDLSAAIQISLWNRNSHSIVKNRGALMVKGSTEINTLFAKSSASFTFSGEAVIDFLTDLDFYDSPFKMCLQMIQPDFHLRFDVQKEESVINSDHKYKSKNKRQLHIPPKSYAMHQKNSDQCVKLLADSY